MGEFRYDEKGNVRYEPANLADAAIMFTGDWDAALRDLDATLPDLGKAETDRLIERGEFLLEPAGALLADDLDAARRDRQRLDAASRSLGEAMSHGFHDGRQRALSDGQPPSPPEPPTDHDDDGSDDEDDDRLELILQRVFTVLIYFSLAYLAAHVVIWILR